MEDNIDAKLSFFRKRRTSTEREYRVPRVRGSHAATKISSPSSEGLQFINLLGTTAHDTEGRNTVRAQARRHAWKNKRDELAASGDAIPRKPATRKPRRVIAPTTVVVKQESPFDDRLKSPSRLSKSTYDDIFAKLPMEVANYTIMALETIAMQIPAPLGISNAHSDPFSAYPIQLTPKMHHLMHYARGVPILNSTDEHEEDLFHMSHTPALVYATLAWITAIAAFHNGVVSDDHNYLLSKSIQAIHKDLNDVVDGKQLSDGTIAAVACLTNMENINGNRKSAHIHMQGLKTMIDFRGGLQVSKVNVFARRLVLWADVLCATRWQTKPRFQLEEAPDILDLPKLEIYRPSSSLQPSFEIQDPNFIAMAYATGNQDIIPIQYELYYLAHFLDNVPARDAGLLDRSSFADRVYVVEHKILQMIERNGGRLPNDSILIPLLHSFLLWLYTNIRLTPPNGQIRLTLIDRLRTHIESSDLPALNRTSPHELRWMLFLGGAASSKGSAQRAWFVNTMVECGCRREWGIWEHIVLGLKGFEKSFVLACEEYWAEVNEARRQQGHECGNHGTNCVGDAEYFVRDWRED